jgi:hypothetical protein
MHLASLRAAAAAAVAATAAVAAAAVLLLAGSPAIGATAGFIGETLFGKEVLLRRGESKFPVAIAAGQRLVLGHTITSQEK